MNDSKSYDRVTELESMIKKYSEQYYFSEEGSDISDEEFDSLVNELTRLNPDSDLLKELNFGAVDTTVPTRKSSHNFVVGGLRKFYRMPTEVKREKLKISPKYDGVSAIAYYKNGVLQKVLTRGDGLEGTDLTKKLIGSHLPKVLSFNFSGALRGELIMKNEIFGIKYSMNYKNPRNTVAGLVNSINSSLQDVDLVIYDIYGSNGEYMTYNEEGINLDSFRSEDIKITQYVTLESKDTENLDTEGLVKIKSYFDMNYPMYNYDGVVCTCPYLVEDLRFAFKVNKDGVESTVVNINWIPSEYGKLIPVVEIDPVDIDGSTVSRVAGNSYNYIVGNKIQIGSKVKVIKSGEIIPYIVDVDNSDSEYVGNINLPNDVWIKGAHAYVKLSSTSIYKKQLFKLMSFAKVRGVGPSILNKFVEHLSRIYTDDLGKSKLDNYLVNEFLFGENEFGKLDFISKGLSSREFNLLQSIMSTEYNYLDVLVALAEEGVSYSKIQKYLSESDPKWTELKDIILSSPRVVEIPDSEVSNSIGLSVVITGKLSKSRRDIESYYKSKGVDISTPKNCDILICNDPLGSQSSKIKLARSRGIPIMTEKEFEEFLNK